jgi:hypothetical protein
MITWTISIIPSEHLGWAKVCEFKWHGNAGYFLVKAAAEEMYLALAKHYETKLVRTEVSAEVVRISGND